METGIDCWSQDGDRIPAQEMGFWSWSIRDVLCHHHSSWQASCMHSSLKNHGGHMTSRGPIYICEYANNK